MSFSNTTSIKWRSPQQFARHSKGCWRRRRLVLSVHPHCLSVCPWTQCLREALGRNGHCICLFVFPVSESQNCHGKRIQDRRHSPFCAIFPHSPQAIPHQFPKWYPSKCIWNPYSSPLLSLTLPSPFPSLPLPSLLTFSSTTWSWIFCLFVCFGPVWSQGFYHLSHVSPFFFSFLFFSLWDRLSSFCLGGLRLRSSYPASQISGRNYRYTGGHHHAVSHHLVLSIMTYPDYCNIFVITLFLPTLAFPAHPKSTSAIVMASLALGIKSNSVTRAQRPQLMWAYFRISNFTSLFFYHACSLSPKY